MAFAVSASVSNLALAPHASSVLRRSAFAGSRMPFVSANTIKYSNKLAYISPQALFTRNKTDKV
jgi:hypothetical protein